MLSHLKLHFNNHSRNDESVLGACECEATAAWLAVGGLTAPTPTHGTTRLH